MIYLKTIDYKFDSKLSDEKVKGGYIVLRDLKGNCYVAVLKGKGINKKIMKIDVQIEKLEKELKLLVNDYEKIHATFYVFSTFETMKKWYTESGNDPKVFNDKKAYMFKPMEGVLKIFGDQVPEVKGIKETYLKILSGVKQVDEDSQLADILPPKNFELVITILIKLLKNEKLTEIIKDKLEEAKKANKEVNKEIESREKEIKLLKIKKQLLEQISYESKEGLI